MPEIIIPRSLNGSYKEGNLRPGKTSIVAAMSVLFITVLYQSYCKISGKVLSDMYLKILLPETLKSKMRHLRIPDAHFEIIISFGMIMFPVEKK